MPKRRNMPREASQERPFKHISSDEGASHIPSAVSSGANGVAPSFSKGESDNYSHIRRPLVEEAKPEGLTEDGKPEGWDDPWYWEGASDQDIPENLSPAQEAVFALNSYYLFGGSHNYHFSSGDSGYAHVETEAIRSCAASGKKTLEQIEELIQSMVSYVTESEAYWQGSTGDFFREGFVLGMKALRHDLQNLSPYTRELIAYADKYDDVITEANVIADSLEHVVWQDV